MIIFSRSKSSNPYLRKKSMCLAAVSGVAVAAAKLLLVCWESWHMLKIMAFSVICRVLVNLV